jgi:hypothetical protein
MFPVSLPNGLTSGLTSGLTRGRFQLMPFNLSALS